MTCDMPLEHWFRGLRVSRVAEGPGEILRFNVARDIPGKPPVDASAANWLHCP
jgi:acyl-CoA dehydrogenase